MDIGTNRKNDKPSELDAMTTNSDKHSGSLGHQTQIETTANLQNSTQRRPTSIHTKRVDGSQRKTSCHKALTFHWASAWIEQNCKPSELDAVAASCDK